MWTFLISGTAIIISNDSPLSGREFKKLWQQLQQRRHRNIELCVRLNALRFFQFDHVVQNRRSTLLLVWNEWFSCKGREWNIYCCGLEFSSEPHVWKFQVMDETLTPSPWTILMDYPNGLPLKNTISDERHVKKLQLYFQCTASTMLFFVCHFTRLIKVFIWGLTQVKVQSTTSRCNLSYKMETGFVFEGFARAVHAGMFCWHWCAVVILFSTVIQNGGWRWCGTKEKHCPCSVSV